MRVRMLSGNQAGQVVDMPRHEAETNVQCGLAERVADEPAATSRARTPGEPGSPPDARPDTPPAPGAPYVDRFKAGGNMYELPDGSRVRGRVKAAQALVEQFKAGGNMYELPGGRRVRGLSPAVAALAGEI